MKRKIQTWTEHKTQKRSKWENQVNPIIKLKALLLGFLSGEWRKEERMQKPRRKIKKKKKSAWEFRYRRTPIIQIGQYKRNHGVVFFYFGLIYLVFFFLLLFLFKLLVILTYKESSRIIRTTVNYCLMTTGWTYCPDTFVERWKNVGKSYKRSVLRFVIIVDLFFTVWVTLCFIFFYL